MAAVTLLAAVLALSAAVLPLVLIAILALAAVLTLVLITILALLAVLPLTVILALLAAIALLAVLTLALLAMLTVISTVGTDNTHRVVAIGGRTIAGISRSSEASGCGYKNTGDRYSQKYTWFATDFGHVFIPPPFSGSLNTLIQ